MFSIYYTKHPMALSGYSILSHTPARPGQSSGPIVLCSEAVRSLAEVLQELPHMSWDGGVSEAVLELEFYGGIVVYCALLECIYVRPSQPSGGVLWFDSDLLPDIIRVLTSHIVFLEEIGEVL